MSWVLLFLAGCCEVIGVMCMKKYTDGYGKKYIIGIILSFVVSFSLLSIVMKTISMATAYAIWTGIGTAGSALAGFIIFKEKATVLNIIFIALIACGAVGLKVLS